MLEAAAVLSAMRLYDEVYLIGGFVRGVTVRKQQIRALNLVWALKENNSLTGSVAVVGGGLSGVTVAAALTQMSQSIEKIVLFERRPSLCPLQRGCDTRWLHPQIYDWPNVHSERRTAGLPIMNWREGRASDVVHQLLREWSLRKERVTRRARITEILGAHYLCIDGDSIEWAGVQHNKSEVKLAGGRDQFDIIIVAVGFGEERNAGAVTATSYWRNETYGQPELDRTVKRILVSGTGDGGLVDLLRVRIQGFRQDTIIEELFGPRPNAVMALRELHNSFVADRLQQAALFASMSEVLEESLLEEITKEVRDRLRKDTVATLQVRIGEGCATTASSIFGQGASFLHNFLTFLLYRAGGFALRFGALETYDLEAFDKLVIRHGTLRREVLEAVFCGADRMQLILDQKEQEESDRTDDMPSWPARFWDGQFGKTAEWQQEYAPGATVLLASAFAAALEGVVDPEDGSQFRATLHRVVGDGKNNFLQQIARYQGTRTRGGEPYRVFPADHGMIGYVASQGRPYRTVKLESLTTRRYRIALNQDNELLHLGRGGAQGMEFEVLSLFACPVISRRTQRTLLVLFVDATSENFFDDPRCRRLVKALHGLVRLLEQAQRRSVPEIEQVSTRDNGVRVEPDSENLLLKVLKEVPIDAPMTDLTDVDFEWKSTLPVF